MPEQPIFLEFMDAAGDTCRVNLAHVIVVSWQRPPPQLASNGRPVPILGQKVLCITTSEVHQATQVSRIVNPADAERVDAVLGAVVTQSGFPITYRPSAFTGED